MRGTIRLGPDLETSKRTLRKQNIMYSNEYITHEYVKYLIYIYIYTYIYTNGSVDLPRPAGPILEPRETKNTAPANKSNICQGFQIHFRQTWPRNKTLENTAAVDKSNVNRLGNVAPVHKSTLTQFRSHSKTPHLPTDPSFKTA